jgi:5S rRNA maturation endonuclease (ribonuclease M5)
VPTWVTKRGFTAETLNRYRLGYSAAFNALVIPVPDAHALIYRAHPGDTAVPKYRYTRDFKAHSILYTRFDFEMKDGTIILVEGPLDALWLRQHGFKNSLSILGGGTVGIKQREVIASIDPSRVVLAFDNDDAGRKTTEKALLWLKRYTCYAVDWQRFGMKYAVDEDGNTVEVSVKDVAELDLADLILMFDSPPLVQAASIPKIGLKRLKKTVKPLDTVSEDVIE